MVSSNHNLTCVKRFVHRTPEELHHQANVSGPLPKRFISNVQQKNEPESDDPPEHAPNTETSLSGPGHSSVPGSDLRQSACIPSLPSIDTSGSAVNTHGIAKQTPNTFPTMPIGNIGMDIDSSESSSVERNEPSVSTSAAGNLKVTAAPLSEHKESNEEIILVSYYVNWTKE